MPCGPAIPQRVPLPRDAMVTGQALSRSVAARGDLRRGHTFVLRAQRWSATVWGAIVGGASTTQR